MEHGKTDGRRPRVGIVGAGAIGRAILADLRASGAAEIAYVAASRPRGAEAGDGGGEGEGVAVLDLEEALRRPVDLVVEAATPQVLAGIASRVLAAASLCAFSCTALADRDLEAMVRTACRASGSRFFVPHGAILALDGLCDGRDAIGSVTLTTTKSGASLGAEAGAEGVLFEGSAREACARFPRNVNVHAAAALAGIGFDRTLSRVVAVPGLERMEHRLEVEGQGFSWDLRVASRSLGGVTGAYTPRSAAGSVRRILLRDGIAVC